MLPLWQKQTKNLLFRTTYQKYIYSIKKNSKIGNCLEFVLVRLFPSYSQQEFWMITRFYHMLEKVVFQLYLQQSIKVTIEKLQ